MTERAAFTKEHQFLVNALGLIAVQVIEDSRWPVVIASIQEILPQAPRNSDMTERLCGAASMLIAAYPTRNKRGQHADWAMAMLAAQAVLADVFFWRGGLALDACRAPAVTPS